MVGSYSSKAVLPALVPGVAYDDLEIADGQMAMQAYAGLTVEADPGPPQAGLHLGSPLRVRPEGWLPPEANRATVGGWPRVPAVARPRGGMPRKEPAGVLLGGRLVGLAVSRPRVASPEGANGVR
jgi:hypothetical protein